MGNSSARRDRVFQQVVACSNTNHDRGGWQLSRLVQDDDDGTGTTRRHQRLDRPAYDQLRPRAVSLLSSDTTPTTAPQVLATSSGRVGTTVRLMRMSSHGASYVLTWDEGWKDMKKNPAWLVCSGGRAQGAGCMSIAADCMGASLPSLDKLCPS
jgi:hypothetical protein